MAAPAAASADTLTPANDVTQLSATEGQPLSGQSVGSFYDSVADDTSADYTATIYWGDGTSNYGTVSGTANTQGPWTVTGPPHTYTEEGGYLMTVTVTDNASSATTSWEIPVAVSDAGLSLPAGAPTSFSGAGSSAAGEMQSFEAAIGGSDNGTAPGEQNGGFRHIAWDDVALNGSDPGSTTISANHVVSVAPNREQSRGIQLGRGVAVANDGFTSVNPSVGGSFPAFSPPNVFAPFNSNQIQMQIVNPAAQSSPTGSATTRGVGIMFLNVEQPNATTIQYYSGSTLIDTVAAPVGGAGQPSFVGVLFQSPAVTQVVITLGSAAIFSFDGSTHTSGPSDPADLVAADDVVLAEPQNTEATIQGTAGIPVSGTLQSFSDTDPNGSAGDYTAAVNWGDGSESGASVTGSNGSFSVAGSHTYMRQGTFQTTTTVTDFGGATQTNHVTVVIGPRSSATSVSCSPAAVVVTNTTTCTATVSDVGGGTSIAPVGTVGFNSSTAGVSFTTDTGCGLKATSTPGKSACSVVLSPGHFPPSSAKVIANYNGDGAHTGSSGSTSVGVSSQTCAVKLLSKRLSPHAKRLPVRVTCDMTATLTITVTEKSPGHAKIKFAHLKTVVTANKKATLHAVLYSAARKVLRTASKRQRMTLKVTVVAAPKTQPVTILVTVKGVRVT